jgi:hypothetical protein
MALYEVKETTPCYVTWTRVIEANSKEEAIQLLTDGDHGIEATEEIGDCLTAFDTQYSAKQVA